MSINSVSISGNLTRDPELRVTSGGTNILRIGVAVNERRKSPSGEWEDHANFIDVTVFGNRGEALSRFLAKGMKVAVTGRLHQQRWETDSGEKRNRLEVIADEVDVMSKEGGHASAPRPDDDLGDDIPFHHLGFNRSDAGHWHHRTVMA